MKHQRWNTILKRGISIAVALITIICETNLPLTSTYANQSGLKENRDSDMERVSIDNDVQIKGTNSFGNLLNDAIQEKLDEQEQSQGYNIYAIEMSEKIATVELDTVEQSQLIVGIYDEAGEKLLATGNTMVEAGSTKADVEIDIDTMPTYYDVKAYLIEPDTFVPLCMVFDCPNYTQEMQEFFAMTTDDFVGKEILNLDEDKTNNFGVFADNVIYIEEQPNVNKVASEDTETMTYIIEDATDSISELSIGDIFALEYESDSLLIIKVGSVQVDGTTVTIIGQDMEIEEAFQYLKLDTDAGSEDAQIDTSNLEEGMTYLGTYDFDEDPSNYSVPDDETVGAEDTTTSDSNIEEEGTEGVTTEEASAEEATTEEPVTEPTTNEDIDNNSIGQLFDIGEESDFRQHSKQNGDVSTTIVEDGISPDSAKGEFAFATKLAFLLDEMKVGGTTVNGTVDYSNALELEFYITNSRKFVSFKLDYAVSVSVSISAKATIPIPLPYFGFSPVPGIYIDFTPSIPIEASITGQISGKVMGTIGFSYDNKEGGKNLTTMPRLVSELKIEGTLFIGLSLKPHIGILGSVVKLTLEAKAGGEISLAQTRSTEKTDSSVHSCQTCFEGDLRLKLSLSAEAKVLNIAKLKRSYDLSWKWKDCYFSLDNQKFAFTTCPNRKYKTEVEVVDEDGTPIIGADIDGEYWIIDDGKPVSGICKSTDADGKAVIYLSKGIQNISISKSGYRSIGKSIHKAEESSKCRVVLKKQGQGNRIDADTFPDKTFREYVKENFDLDGDGKLSKEEADKVIEIDVSDKDIITSLDGIDCFENLKELYCYGNQLSSLDVSQNKGLTFISCGNNQLTSLDVSQNEILRYFFCSDNQLSSLDVSQNEKLIELDCGGNQLSSLDVSQNKELRYFFCSDNQLTSLDISQNEELHCFDCGGNQLSSLDVSKNPSLTQLICDSNQLTSLDISQNENLVWLGCYNNQLTSLDISQNGNLGWLYCSSNQLTSLDISQNENLEVLYCHYNELSSLDVSKNPSLVQLVCGNNQLSSLDVSENTSLVELYCYNNQLSSLDVSQNTSLEVLSCYSNQLSSLDVSKNPGLVELKCYSNQLSSLDVSQNTSLEVLNCYDNQLSSLDVGQNTNLKVLNCYINQLSSLDVSKNTNLVELRCFSNQLSSLDVSQNTSLEVLKCYSNQLSSLDVSKDTSLVELDCHNNVLSSLDVSKNTSLVELYCYNNQISSLDVSKNINLKELYCDSDVTAIGWPRTDSASADSKFPSEAVVSKDIESSVDDRRNDLPQEEELGVKEAYDVNNEENVDRTEVTSPSVYTDLIPNAVYNYYIMKYCEDGLSAGNLLYIMQVIADKNGEVSIPFAYNTDWESPETMLVCMEKTDISTATITIDDMYYNTQVQQVQPKVELNGSVLVEGYDYELSGDYSATEVGNYTVRINGIGLYTGTFDKEYRIKPAQVTGITVSSKNLKLAVGQTQKLTTVIVPDYAENKEVTWESSDTAVATVDATGKITAKSVGTATITCTAKDGSGVNAACKVTVTTPVKVKKIVLNKTSAYMSVNEVLSLTKKVYPSNVTNKNVSFSSSNTKVATVDSNGKVTAKGAGTATITCTAKDGSGVKATCKVTVYSNTEAFVARIYTKALGRDPEPAGLKYWTNEINTKKRTPVNVAESFFFAPEFTNKNLSDTEYIKVLYRTFMGREYDQGGLNYWLGRLAKGESRKSVMKAFAGCPEFQKIVKSFGL